MRRQALNFINDTIKINRLLYGDRLKKNASGGLTGDIISTFYGMFSTVQNSPNKVQSIQNILSSGDLFSKSEQLKQLADVSKDTFGLDVNDVLRTIGSNIGDKLNSDSELSDNDIESIVDSAIKSVQQPPISQEEFQQIYKVNSDLSSKEIRRIKLGVILFDNHLFSNQSNSGFIDNRLKYKNKISSTQIWDKSKSGPLSYRFQNNPAFSATKNYYSKFLESRGMLISVIRFILKWILKLLLGFGGFYVIGKILQSLFGDKKPEQDKNIIDRGVDAVKNFVGINTKTWPKSMQKTFTVSPNYYSEYKNSKSNVWMVDGDVNSIDDILLKWSIEVYPQLSGHEDKIRSSNNFKEVCEYIKENNGKTNLGYFAIPESFHSKKEIVDTFIDEVAVKFSQSKQ